MASSGDAGFRIKVLLSLFVIVTLLYSSYSIFNPEDIGDYTSFGNTTNYTASDTTLSNQSLDETYDYNTEDSQNFIDMLFGFGDFMTFGGVEEYWARMFLNSVTTICFIGIGFVIYLFVRDWVPFV